jgi:predicted metal-dependent hydrolase
VDTTGLDYSSYGEAFGYSYGNYQNGTFANGESASGNSEPGNNGSNFLADNKDWVSKNKDHILITEEKNIFDTKKKCYLDPITGKELKTDTKADYMLPLGDGLYIDTRVMDGYDSKTGTYGIARFAGAIEQLTNLALKDNKALDKLNLTDNQKKFFKEYVPIIISTLKDKQTGIKPSVAIAQAALESGWGSKADKTLFGIKGHGITIATHEYVNGKMIKINDEFLVSTSTIESVQQYIDYLTGNPRYSDALSQTDPLKQTKELEKAGYATDPDYSTKLNGIISKYNLTIYD